LDFNGFGLKRSWVKGLWLMIQYKGSGYVHIWVCGVYGYVDIWVCVWVYGYVGYMGIRIYGYVDMWVCGYMGNMDM
jgi:hypothetical protein